MKEERNIYVGNRYVPKIMGEWNKQESYEGLSIVTYEGTSYTSKKGVPIGVDILNESYWVVTGNYNAQIELYREEVRQQSKMIDLLKQQEKELQNKTNYISVKNYEQLKVPLSKGFDWSIPIQTAINEALKLKKKVMLNADEDMYLTKSIVPFETSKIEGYGKFNSILKPIGAIKAIDLSNSTAKTGVELSSFGIYGDLTDGQIGIDTNYITNGSHLYDLSIENCDTGLKIEKSWYAAFEKIFIRGNKKYGLHGISSSSSKQINALNFNELSIQGGLNCVYLEGINVSASIKFDGCTFEGSKKTAIVSDSIAPLTFDNCYFERNYSDGTTIDVLKWDTPINVKVSSRGRRNQIKFVNTYFAQSNNFLESEQKTGVYIGGGVSPVFDNCIFVCNTSNYINAQIYSVSTFNTIIKNCSEDGYAKKMYIGKQSFEVVGEAFSIDLADKASLSLHSIIEKLDKYSILFIPNQTKTVTTAPSIQIKNGATNEIIVYESKFPYSFETNKPIEIGLTNFNQGTVLTATILTASSEEVKGSLFIIRKHNDY